MLPTRLIVAANAAVLALTATTAVVGVDSGDEPDVIQNAAAAPVSPLPTAAPTAPPTTAPTTDPPAAPPASAPAPGATAPQPRTQAAGERDLSLYRGLGTWVDVYDFAPEFGGSLNPEQTVDQMAAVGVTTLYLQAAKEDERSPGLLVRPDLVERWVARAHARGMQVQAWYLPTFESLERDAAHLRALLAFRVNGRGFDSLGLDIESRDVTDLATRNARLIALARALRRGTDLPLSGIVLAPVHTDIVSPTFWPQFPWQELSGLFDVWQTMGYWTDRKSTSPYRDAYTNTMTNLRLMREHLGDVPLHPIGGIGVENDEQARGYVRALTEGGALGGSLYDWNTTPAEAYAILRDVPGSPQANTG